MKTIDVLLIPEEIAKSNLNGKLVIMIDVLRASSTIVTALARGCKGFIPIFSPLEAQKKAKCFQEKNCLLCGERKGKKILGFDLGNSPHEFKKEIVKQKQIIFTTTNGVKVLEMSKNAVETVICSFLNMSAVCEYCLSFNGDILILCAGREGHFSLEDTVCAGMLINSIRYKMQNDFPKSDANTIAQILYLKYSTDLLGMLKESQHGKYLINIGLDKDLEYCSTVDLFSIVPVYNHGTIVKCNYR